MGFCLVVESKNLEAIRFWLLASKERMSLSLLENWAIGNQDFYLGCGDQKTLWEIIMRKSKLFAWWYSSDPIYEKYELVRHHGVWKLRNLKTGLLHNCIHYDSRFPRKKIEELLLKFGYHEVK